MMKELIEELAVLQPVLEQDPKCQSRRRLYIRTTFAIVEGYACLLRENARRHLFSRFANTLSIEIQKAHFLDDYSYEIRENGEIRRKNRCDYPLASHLAFTLRTLAEEVGSPTDFISGNGWDAFNKSVKIRNRITHPKTSADIFVTDEEYETLHEGISWATSTCQKILDKESRLVSSDGEQGGQGKA
jgi:hypothetical protein